MNTRDCLNIGLKLLGVYAVLLGVNVAAVMLLNLVYQTLQTTFQRGQVIQTSDSAIMILFGAAQPVAYFVCAFILTRKTDWCLALIGYPAQGASPDKESTKCQKP